MVQRKGKEKNKTNPPHVIGMARTFICNLLKLNSEGTAFSFSTRLLHSRLKQSLVKCCEQMLLYFVGLKLRLFIAETHFPQRSGLARGNLHGGGRKKKETSSGLRFRD